jgi:hypothetical protein
MTPTEPELPRSPMARAVGACAACIMIGVVVCLTCYLLRAVDFAPLRALIAFEDRLYVDLVTPRIELGEAFHPVVFVDVDDEAIHRWGPAQAITEGTPRALIAELTHVIRGGGAAVIFLDYDFRNSLADDAALSAELAGPSAVPVLLPKYLEHGGPPPCDRQGKDRAPAELPTVFNRGENPTSVASVHAIVLLGAYGLVEGSCSFYLVRDAESGEVLRREAAMMRAVTLAGLPSGSQGAVLGSDTPEVISSRWRIRNDTDVLRDPGGRLAFARIRASLYVRKNEVDVSGLDLSALHGAVAIIGSSHRWADDFHATSVGDLPGALVHANLALDLQSLPAQEMGLGVQFGLDILLILASSLLTIPLCWVPVFRRIPPGARLTLRMRLFRLVREGLVIIGFGVALAFAYLVLVRIRGDALAGWRFGMLSFTLSAAVVLMIEVTAAVADAAAEIAEALVVRLGR